MKHIREILPGIFQCLIFSGQEVQATIYVNRSFGNYLFYHAPVQTEFFRLIQAKGGVVKYFHDPSHDDRSAKQFFARFGATSVFLDAPQEKQDFRWELFADQQALYQGLKLVRIESLPQMTMYLLQHKDKRLLLPNALLALHNGHWSLRQTLTRRQKDEVTNKLAEIEFDYLIPQYFSGYISFQLVEQNFKEIQLRHLAHAAV